MDQALAWIEQNRPVAEELTRFCEEVNRVMLTDNHKPAAGGGQ
jgi:hypothetical protein